MTKIRINIALKKGVLDTQGKAIENVLNKNLDYPQLNNVRQGKFVELELPETNAEQIKKIVEEICTKLLVNTVIETYTYQIIN